MSHSAGEKVITITFCPLVLSFATWYLGLRVLVCHSHDGAGPALQTCQVCRVDACSEDSVPSPHSPWPSPLPQPWLVRKQCWRLTPGQEIDGEGACYKMLARLTSLMGFMKFRELLHASYIMKWKQFYSLLQRKQTETSLGQFLGHFFNIYANFSVRMTKKCFRTCFHSIPLTAYRS